MGRRFDLGKASAALVAQARLTDGWLRSQEAPPERADPLAAVLTQLTQLVQPSSDEPRPTAVSLSEAADRAEAALVGVTDRTIATGRGPSRLSDLVATCVAEIVSRSLDLSADVPLHREALATTVRLLADLLADRHPGRAVELRVPPFVAVQLLEGTVHRRGTPPAVVEMDPVTWVRLATGRQQWAEARVTASGERSDLSPLLPVLT